MQASHVERPFGTQNLYLETGRLAKQAHGAVVVRYGDTVTLVAAVEGEADEGRDFFPLDAGNRSRSFTLQSPSVPLFRPMTAECSFGRAAIGKEG